MTERSPAAATCAIHSFAHFTCKRLHLTANAPRHTCHCSCIDDNVVQGVGCCACRDVSSITPDFLTSLSFLDWTGRRCHMVSTSRRRTPRASTPGRATMHDVAALAGVSLKSVSRVVNREPGVSAELARKVGAAVAELGYRHNLGASNLRRGQRTASIGVLVQDLSNGFCSEVLRAIEDRARSRGVVVMASSIEEDAGAGTRSRRRAGRAPDRRPDPDAREPRPGLPRRRPGCRARGGRRRPEPARPPPSTPSSRTTREALPRRPVTCSPTGTGGSPSSATAPGSRQRWNAGTVTGWRCGPRDPPRPRTSSASTCAPGTTPSRRPVSCSPWRTRPLRSSRAAT